MRLAAAARMATVLIAVSMGAAAASPEDGGWSSHGGDLSVGRAVSVAAGSEREADLMVVGANAVIDGSVKGDVVALRGDVQVTGHVEGDVLALMGRVALEPGATVSGDAFAVGGPVDVAPGASVGGDTRAMLVPGPGHGSAYLRIAFSPPGLVLRMLSVLFWTIAALVASFVAPSAVVRAALHVRSRLARSMLVGLLLQASLVLTLVLFVALVVIVVGIPLLALLVLAWILLGALGFAAAFHALGARLSERSGARAMSGYAHVLLGALVVGASHFVPYLGELTWALAFTAGIGAALTTWRRGESNLVR